MKERCDQSTNVINKTIEHVIGDATMSEMRRIMNLIENVSGSWEADTTYLAFVSGDDVIVTIQSYGQDDFDSEMPEHFMGEGDGFEIYFSGSLANLPGQQFDTYDELKNIFAKLGLPQLGVPLPSERTFDSVFYRGFVGGKYDTAGNRR